MIPGQNSIFSQKTPVMPLAMGTVFRSYPAISNVAKSGIDFFGIAIESGVLPEKGPSSYFAPGGSELTCTGTVLLEKRVAHPEPNATPTTTKEITAVRADRRITCDIACRLFITSIPLNLNPSRPHHRSENSMPVLRQLNLEAEASSHCGRV